MNKWLKLKVLVSVVGALYLSVNAYLQHDAVVCLGLTKIIPCSLSRLAIETLRNALIIFAVLFLITKGIKYAVKSMKKAKKDSNGNNKKEKKAEKKAKKAEKKTEREQEESEKEDDEEVIQI